MSDVPTHMPTPLMVHNMAVSGHQRKAEREEDGRRAGEEIIATVITNKNHLSHL